MNQSIAFVLDSTYSIPEQFVVGIWFHVQSHVKVLGNDEMGSVLIDDVKLGFWEVDVVPAFVESGVEDTTRESEGEGESGGVGEREERAVRPRASEANLARAASSKQLPRPHVAICLYANAMHNGPLSSRPQS